MALSIVAITAAACDQPGGSILAGGGLSDRAWQHVVDSVQQSVLRVNVDTCLGPGSGSGFVISGNQLVTNAHVVGDAEAATLDVPDGSTPSVNDWSAQKKADLAVVRTEGAVPTALRLADADPIPGDQVRAIGYPLGGPLTATAGRVIEYVSGTRFGYPGRLIRTSVAIRPGNSGGPLIDTHGHVVGVVSAVQLADGVALAIPVSQLRADLSELQAAETTPPAACSKAKD